MKISQFSVGRFSYNTFLNYLNGLLRWKNQSDLNNKIFYKFLIDLGKEFEKTNFDDTWRWLILLKFIQKQGKNYEITSNFRNNICPIISNQIELEKKLRESAFQNIIAFRYIITILLEKEGKISKKNLNEFVSERMKQNNEVIYEAQKKKKILTKWSYPGQSFAQLINYGVKTRSFQVQKEGNKNFVEITYYSKNFWNSILNKQSKVDTFDNFEKILIRIYNQALKLNNIGDFIYTKDAKFIAESIFNFKSEEFSKKFCKYLVDNYNKVEIGRGISSHLVEKDAIICNLPNEDVRIFYFRMKV